MLLVSSRLLFFEIIVQVVSSTSTVSLLFLLSDIGVVFMDPFLLGITFFMTLQNFAPLPSLHLSCSFM